MNPPCRLKIQCVQDCFNRQVKNWRWTRKHNLNVIFASCYRPEVCDHWLSDEAYEEAQSKTTVHRRPFQYNGPVH